MAGNRIDSGAFVTWLQRQLATKCGYIMGTGGQDPRELGRRSWYFRQYADRNEYTEAQEQKALYWYDHAPRVFDCAGMAEGAVAELLGLRLKDVDTKARYIYSGWCRGANGTDMDKLPRIPGVAVFKTKSSPARIHHIGYLERPVVDGDTDGDWYIIEAKGVAYGVVRTRLSDGGWNCWGKMLKYFDYSGAAAPARPAKPGDVRITRRSVNIRSGPGTGYPIVTVAHRGDLLEGIKNPDGWRMVMIDGTVRFVSPRMSEEVEGAN